MKRPALALFLCLLATGLDVRAQDITDEIPDTTLERIGVTCTALVVFTYARHESYLAQALVAHAIVNRQAGLAAGADACDVVQVPGAFPRLEALPFPREPWRVDPVAWAQALSVAQVVIAGDYAIPRPMLRVTHFTERHVPTSSIPIPATVQVGEVGALVFFESDGVAQHAAAGRQP